MNEAETEASSVLVKKNVKRLLLIKHYLMWDGALGGCKKLKTWKELNDAWSRLSNQ